MMSNITISTIIPTYNGARYLRATIDSVLAQRHPSIEVIVVDDASTDGTVELIRSYGDSVRLVQNKVSRGTAAARNSGLRASSGEWIALLDHDDLWLPERLERQVKMLREEPNLDVLFAAIRFFDSADGRTLDRYFPGEALNVHDILGHKVLTVQTLLMRRSALEAVGGFDESLRGTDDWDLSIRLANKYRLRGVDTVLADVRIHAGQQGAAPELMFENSMRVLRKHGKGNLHGRCGDCRRAIRHTRRVLRKEYYQRLATQAGAAWRAGRGMRSIALRTLALWRYPEAIARVPRRLVQSVRTDRVRPL